MKSLVIAFSILFIFSNCVFPQTNERKKPKIKDFGSSLKRSPQENLSPKKSDQKQNNQDDEIIKIDTKLVVIDCLVIDEKGKIIQGLAKEDFVISEDSQPQEVQTFANGNDNNLPRSIVLIIDYSGSQLPFIEQSIEAAKLLVDKLRPNDLMAVVTDDVELIVQFTSDKLKIKNELENLKKNALSKKFGRSSQYSSLYAVLNEMLDQTDVRPIILFQTDGDQVFGLKGGIDYLAIQQILKQKNLKFQPILSMPNFGYNDLIQKIEQSRATIYTIVPGFRRIGLSPEKKEAAIKAEAEMRQKLFERTFKQKPSPPNPNSTFSEFQTIRDELVKKYYPDGMPDTQDALFRLSYVSGGWIEFLEKPEDAEGIYSRIFDLVNTRYIIGYNPTNETKDGKRRTIKVSIKNHPEYIIWGKQSYLAPLPD